MNRKHHTAFAFLAALVCFASHMLSASVWAQNKDTQPAQNDFLCPENTNQAPNNVLSQVQKNYDAVNFFSASFTQSSYLFALDTEEKSSGTVWFQKPGEMKWLYLAPEEQVFLFRDNTFWYYQSVDQQLFIDEMKGAFQSDLPLSFLMGIGSLHENFTVQGSCKKGSQYSLRLKPRESTPDDTLSEFYLLVDRITYFPQGAMTVDISQNSTAIVLSHISEKKPQDVRAIFKADFPAGIDVQDNRKNS